MPTPIYAYFDGIDGSNEQSGREKSVQILEANHVVEIPVDVKDASATSKRLHRAFELTANVDKATPLLAECVCNSKTIATVKLEYWRINEEGIEENYFNVEMEKVRIVKMKNWFPNVDYEPTGTYKHMMTYDLRYDKITWTYTDGNLSFSDEWKKPNAG